MPNAYGAKSHACVLVAPPSSPPDSITVALSSALDGAGLYPWRTTPEGQVAAQSHETLLGVECAGQLYPQLARISLSEVVAHASPRVRVRSIDASAARDALDAGVDLLVTDDPAVVSYAALRDDLLSVRLPWERVYVVLASEVAPPEISATRRLTLAELVADAVRADARTAQPPFWWESSERCAAPVTTNHIAAAPRSSRVVYQSGDRVARGIAERLVALAGRRSRGEDSVFGALLPGLPRAGARATAIALSANELAPALRVGDDLAYVLPLPRLAAARCDEFAKLISAVPWLQSVIPLIDTRSVAIVRRDRVGLSVDADGSLRLLDGVSARNRQP